MRRATQRRAVCSFFWRWRWRWPVAAAATERGASAEALVLGAGVVLASLSVRKAHAWGAWLHFAAQRREAQRKAAARKEEEEAAAKRAAEERAAAERAEAERAAEERAEAETAEAERAEAEIESWLLVHQSSVRSRAAGEVAARKLAAAAATPPPAAFDGRRFKVAAASERRPLIATPVAHAHLMAATPDTFAAEGWQAARGAKELLKSHGQRGRFSWSPAPR